MLSVSSFSNQHLCFRLKILYELTIVFSLVQIAELVATEFFEQGDKERRELNIEPSVSAMSLKVLFVWQIFFSKYNISCGVSQGFILGP